MRRFLRLASAVMGLGIGLALLVMASATMILIGPDDTITTREHAVATETFAIATEPMLLQYYGPTLHVSARSTTGKPVFVGVASQVDAESYLANTPREMVDDVGVPWALSSRAVDTDQAADVAAPAGLDFWVVSATGTGERSVAWPIANGPYSIVVMNGDATTGVSTLVKVGLKIEHSFLTAAAVAGAGLVLVVLAGVLLRRRSPAGAPGDGA